MADETPVTPDTTDKPVEDVDPLVAQRARVDALREEVARRERERQSTGVTVAREIKARRLAQEEERLLAELAEMDAAPEITADDPVVLEQVSQVPSVPPVVNGQALTNAPDVDSATEQPAEPAENAVPAEATTATRRPRAGDTPKETTP